MQTGICPEGTNITCAITHFHMHAYVDVVSADRINIFFHVSSGRNYLLTGSNYYVQNWVVPYGFLVFAGFGVLEVLDGFGVSVLSNPLSVAKVS